MCAQRIHSAAATFLEKAIAFYQEDKVSEALNAAEMALEFDARNRDIWDVKGKCHAILREPEKAIVALNHALKYGEGDAYTYFFLGAAYTFVHNYKIAKARLRQAYALNPHDPSIIWFLANTLASDGDYKGNESVFRQAIKLLDKKDIPTGLRLYYALAKTVEARSGDESVLPEKDYREIQRVFKEGIAFAPHVQSLALEFAKFYMRTADSAPKGVNPIDEARRVAEEIVATCNQIEGKIEEDEDNILELPEIGAFPDTGPR
jgi:tetratricopeptide (TPR) repeat protein